MTEDTKKVKVLIIEDEPLTSWAICKSLEKRSFFAKCLSTVKEALETIEREHFDFYIIDVFLPDGSGFEIIDKLKKRGEENILLITAFGELEKVRKKIVALNLKKVIKKPFDVEEIVQKYLPGNKKV